MIYQRGRSEALRLPVIAKHGNIPNEDETGSFRLPSNLVRPLMRCFPNEDEARRFVSQLLTPYPTGTVLLHIEGYAGRTIEAGVQMVVDVHFMRCTPGQEEDVALSQGVELAGIGEQVIHLPAHAFQVQVGGQ